MTLDNVETSNAAHPDTFKTPSREERAALRPGDLAKITLSDENKITLTDEFGRMCVFEWVRVTETTPGGRYIGLVDATICHPFPEGYRIEFDPEQIAEIWPDRDTQWHHYVSNPDSFLAGVKHALAVERQEFGSPEWSRAIDAADAEGLRTETLDALTDLGFMSEAVRARVFAATDVGRAAGILGTH